MRRTRGTIAFAISALLAACATGTGENAHRRSARKTTTTSRTTPTSSTTTSTTTTMPPTSSTAPATTTTRTFSASTPGLAAVAGKVIVVDAGHNGGNAAHSAEIARPIFIGTQTRACDTTGTQTNDGYAEHAYTLDVALRLRDLLAGAGASVVMTRTDDAGVGPCIDERAAIGNRAHAVVGISIHADGGPSGGRGFHVNMPANIVGYTDDIYVASHRLGVDLRDAYAAGTGVPPATYIGSSGLVERSDFGGLNLSDVPKVLFETGNMRNATDAALVRDAGFRQRVAAALATGIGQYLAGR